MPCCCAQTACDLELWQEAFRSVEDIQGLMALGKKTPKPQLMAIYYARLTRIFTVSGSHLYNGYAWCAFMHQHSPAAGGVASPKCKIHHFARHLSHLATLWGADIDLCAVQVQHCRSVADVQS